MSVFVGAAKATWCAIHRATVRALNGPDLPPSPTAALEETWAWAARPGWLDCEEETTP
jgi:hypothetical protein